MLAVAVTAACGGVGSDRDAPDAGWWAPGGSTERPEPDAGNVMTDPTNPGWIGGACASVSDCAYAKAVCLGEAAGFPGGMCSLPCDGLCPDLAAPANTATFCISDAAANGTCVSRCDFNLLPETGCRAGYGCIQIARHGEADKRVDACVPIGSDGAPHALNDLQPALERAALAANIQDERVALLDVTDPNRPVLAALRGMEPVYPASIIKVVVMAEVEHQVEQGTLSLDSPLTITAEQDTCDSVPSSDTRPRLETGDVAKVGYLVDLMITRSDNTATNALIDRIGRTKATAYMAALGLPSLQVHRKVFGCSPYDDSGWDGVHLNTMTALETARLYQLILDGGPSFVGASSRSRMQTVLGGQLWRGGVAAGLAPDAVFLSKTGDTSQVVHDSGIILWKGRRYIVAAFLELSPSIGRPRLKELGHQLQHVMETRP